MGKKLKEAFKGKIVVKDLDELRDEFIARHYQGRSWKYIDSTRYQQYIDDYVARQKKPIVFVGLNDNTVYGRDKKLYYDVHATHTYYLDVEERDLLRQKCTRLLRDIQEDEGAMSDLMHNNAVFIKKFTDAIRSECDAKKNKEMNERWKRDYDKQGYRIMNRERVCASVSRVLRHYFTQRNK